MSAPRNTNRPQQFAFPDIRPFFPAYGAAKVTARTSRRPIPTPYADAAVTAQTVTRESSTLGFFRIAGVPPRSGPLPLPRRRRVRSDHHLGPRASSDARQGPDTTLLQAVADVSIGQTREFGDLLAGVALAIEPHDMILQDSRFFAAHVASAASPIRIPCDKSGRALPPHALAPKIAARALTCSGPRYEPRKSFKKELGRDGETPKSGLKLDCRSSERPYSSRRGRNTQARKRFPGAGHCPHRKWGRIHVAGQNPTAVSAARPSRAQPLRRLTTEESKAGLRRTATLPDWRCMTDVLQSSIDSHF